MSNRASGGALAASLIMAAIVGFAGGAYFGTQAEGSGSGNGSSSLDNPPATTPDGQTPPADGTETEGDDQGTEEPVAGGLTLEAAAASVAPNEKIELSGAFDPPEAGIVVRVQRSLDGGEWENFPGDGEPPIEATTQEDGTFSTHIRTQREGVNSIRVLRVDDESVVSNVVEVTVG